jgi:hypothetical protein
MTIASDSRVHMYITDDAQGQSRVFMRLKRHGFSCFLVRSFLILSHKEHIIFHIKYEIEIFVRK